VVIGTTTETGIGSKLKAMRRACRNVRVSEKVRCKWHGTDLGVGVDLQSLRRRGVESGDLRDVVVLPLSLFYLQLKGVPWTGPFWISFIRWVVKLEILLCSRFEGTTCMWVEQQRKTSISLDY
jgi:hypothetical protein